MATSLPCDRCTGAGVVWIDPQTQADCPDCAGWGVLLQLDSCDAGPTLRPCPHCGSTDLATHDSRQADYIPSSPYPDTSYTVPAYVECRRCHAKGPTGWTADEAVGFWNVRAENRPLLRVTVGGDGEVARVERVAP